jgi:hypothetical protein
MARHKDPVVAEVKRARRRVSRRLMEADRKGRLREELQAMHRRAEQALRDAAARAKAARKRAQA